SSTHALRACGCGRLRAAPVRSSSLPSVAPRSLDGSSAAAGCAGTALARGARCRHQESFMLRIYSVALELVRSLKPAVEEFQRRDPDLAKQFRRAVTSVPLNLSEGSYSRGRNRYARYHTAAGSLREALSCLEV